MLNSPSLVPHSAVFSRRVGPPVRARHSSPRPGLEGGEGRKEHVSAIPPLLRTSGRLASPQNDNRQGRRRRRRRRSSTNGNLRPPGWDGGRGRGRVTGPDRAITRRHRSRSPTCRRGRRRCEVSPRRQQTRCRSIRVLGSVRHPRVSVNTRSSGLYWYGCSGGGTTQAGGLVTADATPPL